MTLLSRRSFLAVALISGTPLRAQPSHNAAALHEKRVALRGYDPVSYFIEGQPVKGSAEFAAEFDGATYWFKSAERRDMFVADPDRYAPQFGGLCTITVAHGGIAEPDPEAWAIADGKLYVFGAKEGVALFRRQTASIIGQAAENWPRLRIQP
jgi:YHS domain-containing protein